MKVRNEITPAQLYLRLNREFTLRQSRRCPACAVPMPFRVDRLEDGAPNWEVFFPPDCGGECAAILQELVAEHQEAYELVPSTEDDDR
jgi:hypothetical protein